MVTGGDRVRGVATIAVDKTGPGKTKRSASCCFHSRWKRATRCISPGRVTRCRKRPGTVGVPHGDWLGLRGRRGGPLAARPSLIRETGAADGSSTAGVVLLGLSIPRRVATWLRPAADDRRPHPPPPHLSSLLGPTWRGGSPCDVVGSSWRGAGGSPSLGRVCLIGVGGTRWRSRAAVSKGHTPRSWDKAVEAARWTIGGM